MDETKNEYPTLPNCPRCKNTVFEKSKSNSHNNTSMLEYIYCSKCHCIVGVNNWLVDDNTNYLLKEIKRLLENMQE